MLSYFDDIWIGFLCEQIIRQSVQLSNIRCPGCQTKLKSPVLHLCQQQSLLEKIRATFDEIRGSVLPAITELYNQIQDRLPHSDDLLQDQQCYVSNGRHFLLTVTCEALYYGRYINEFIDDLINQAFIIQPKSKTTKAAGKRKKVSCGSTLTL